MSSKFVWRGCLLLLVVWGLQACTTQKVKTDIANLWERLGAQAKTNDQQDFRLSRVEKSVIELSLPGDTLFAADSAQLSLNSVAQLEKIAKILADYPEVTIVVAGHTDSIGSPVHNMTLSKRRAEMVANVLYEGGMQKNQIQTVGFGESKPVASNFNSSGRKSNRRVTVTIAQQGEDSKSKG